MNGRKARIRRWRCERCSSALTVDQRARKQRFCSRECAYPTKASLQCRQCGEQFIPKDRRRRTFCSRECAFQYQSAQAQRRQALLIEQVSPRRSKCAICGQSMNAKSTLQKYCNEACRREVNRRRSARYYSPAAERNEPVEIDCAMCGAKFSTTFRAARRKYCGKRCAKRAERLSERARKRHRGVL